MSIYKLQPKTLLSKTLHSCSQMIIYYCWWKHVIKLYIHIKQHTKLCSLNQITYHDADFLVIFLSNFDKRVPRLAYSKSVRVVLVLLVKVIFDKNRVKYELFWRCSVVVSDQICPIGHLKIQDGDHFSRRPPFCIFKLGLVLKRQ